MRVINYFDREIQNSPKPRFNRQNLKVANKTRHPSVITDNLDDIFRMNSEPQKILSAI